MSTSATTNTFHSVSKPISWPNEIEETYDAIRLLGKGAFGLVWLAKSKQESKDDTYVAVKQIETRSDKDRAYAKRELSILEELNHPCIIRLVQACNPTDPKSQSHTIVMSLADGPDIGRLISLGGALSLPLARLVSRHLIAAVGYCHGRGVLHRDLKPQNLVLARKNGSPETASTVRDFAGDDTLWCKTGDGESYESMERKWVAVLVDFGFARAVGPTDLVEVEKTTIVSQRITISKRIKKMSALGTPGYVAPEIERTVRNQPDASPDASFTLADTVADYGMASEAFSVGMACRTVLTGVPAREAPRDTCGSSVAEYISFQKNPIVRVVSWMAKSRADRDEKGRKRRYRHLLAMPKDAVGFIRDLTKTKAGKRMTVRQAQKHRWIRGGEGEPDYELPQGNYPSSTGSPINFLNFMS